MQCAPAEDPDDAGERVLEVRAHRGEGFQIRKPSAIACWWRRRHSRARTRNWIALREHVKYRQQKVRSMLAVRCQTMIV